MTNFNIEVIPHKSQRYNTVGDYWTDQSGTVHIKISELGDADYENLVLIHEITEIMLCKAAGITDEVIDEFDIAFDKNRPEGDMSEPGNDPKAPYYVQHQFATKAERDMAVQLGIDWDTYEDRLKQVMLTYR